MLKQELKRIIKNKLLYIGLAIVILIMFIMFYNDALGDKDGNNYIVNIEPKEMAHLTQYEKIEYQKSVCAPYINRELDDEIVLEFLNIYYNDILPYQKNFIYKETPIYNIVYLYTSYLYNYSEERLQELGDGYKVIDLESGKYIIPTVAKFKEINNFDKPIIIENGAGWMNLTENLSASYAIGLIVISIIFISIFSSDNRYNIKGLILSTKYGREKNAAIRIAASFIVAGCFFALITAIDSAMYFSIYGTGGGGAPLYMLEYSRSFVVLETSISAIFWQYVFAGLIIYLVFTAFTLFLSALIKSEFIGLIVSVFMLLLPWVIKKFFTTNNQIVNSFINITPIGFADMTPGGNGVYWYTDKIFGVPFSVPLVLGYTIFCGIFIIAIIFNMKRKEDL